MMREQKSHISFQQIIMLKLVVDSSVVMIILLKVVMEIVQELIQYLLV